MPGDSTLVGGRALDEVIRQIIAEVLVIAQEDVQPGKALVRDLGAESIDFLDLIFQLEDELGVRIPFPRWKRFIMENYKGADLAVVITPEVIQEFAEQVLGEQ
jgi:acyl carrier protein